MAFIHEDFLLHSESARRLYHEYAKAEPILDFHSHLSPKDITENRQFANLYEIWLEGDHYKWRAMRASGVPERFITGNASPYEKFIAWAKTVPAALRNPLYHWTHLELKRYFGIEYLLDETNATKVWEKANFLLATDALRTQEILCNFNVRAICTTDDPTDDLCRHRQHAASGSSTKMFPTFRPDKALGIDRPELFNAWVERLAEAANKEVRTLADFMDALRARHNFFHEVGCRLSDHGLPHCYAQFPSEAKASAIFQKARSGSAASPEEYEQFASFMMLFFGHLDAEKGWTKQLHLGARRNANTRAMRELGPDTGFDSIGDWPQGDSLGRYLDALDRENALPKTIVYNLNPADNYLFATMIGNFQDGSVAGKVQLGSGWWFLDQKEGMEWQLNALSNAGLLSRFVGMVTDSRSFMSFPRHEYFRRVLCNLLGADMERGELPRDFDLVGKMVKNICFGNARQYLGLALD
ncbi:MAG TPA: glucuronate isomerase [Terriglobales bacterium]|nr:glucuronate isomerase [Terriglobales bacterium]